MEVKKTFEEPKVEKVEFDFKTRIAASNCPDFFDWTNEKGDCTVNGM